MRDFKRTSSRFGGRSSERRSFDSSRQRSEMFNTVCDECGKNCSVPFKPTGNKKVYCSDCFERQGGRESSNRGRRDSSFQDRRYSNDERVEYTAICDECGSKCTLPFKPTSSKPVYCSTCFEQKGGKGSDHKAVDNGKEIRELKDQIISINTKLDKIIKALDIKPEKVRTPKVLKVTKEEYISALADEVAEEKKPVKAKKTAKKAVKKSTKKKEKKAD
jgi:CxxC-x17-CxxC domain-containing protein